MVNFLPWKDVSRTSRIFSPKIAIASQIYACLSVTPTKRIINLLLIIIISNPAISYPDEFRKKATKLSYITVLVTRYGPQSVAQRKWLCRLQPTTREIFQTRQCRVTRVSARQRYWFPSWARSGLWQSSKILEQLTRRLFVLKCIEILCAADGRVQLVARF